MLVGTDGTVTHILEAYAGEPVEVEKLVQAFDTADRTDERLALDQGEQVLRRQVLLRTANTRRNLVYAEVVVAVARAGPALVDGLVATDKPIGVLLAEHRMETLREILSVDLERAGLEATHFDVDASTRLVVRTYRIVARGRPVLLITEKFPTSLFRGLPG